MTMKTMTTTNLCDALEMSQAAEWEKIFADNILGKGVASKTGGELPQLDNDKTTQFKKIGKRLELTLLT